MESYSSSRKFHDKRKLINSFFYQIITEECHKISLLWRFILTTENIGLPCSDTFIQDDQ